MVAAFICTIMACVGVFAVVRFAFHHSMKSGAYEMDSGRQLSSECAGNFFGLCHEFTALYRSLGMAATFAGIIAAYQHEPLSAAFLTMSAITGYLYAGLLPMFYESYLQTRFNGPSNFTRGKYSAMMGLAVSAVMFFAFGLLTLAAMLISR